MGQKKSGKGGAKAAAAPAAKPPAAAQVEEAVEAEQVPAAVEAAGVEETQPVTTVTANTTEEVVSEVTRGAMEERPESVDVTEGPTTEAEPGVENNEAPVSTEGSALEGSPSPSPPAAVGAVEESAQPLPTAGTEEPPPPAPSASSPEKLPEPPAPPAPSVDHATAAVVVAEVAVAAAPAKPKQAQRFEALDGLRGVVAVWITLFHSFYYSDVNLALAGSVQMPLFFILSGFVLAITDGKTRHGLMPCCQELCPPGVKSPGDPAPMNARNFYQRRLVRIVPLFFLANLVAAPLMWVGHGYHKPEDSLLDWVLTFTGTSTWLGIPFVINGPSWFVSTLLFFYWIFPSLLPRLQGMSTDTQRHWVGRHYFLQLFIAYFLMIFLSEPISPGAAFWFATAWPPSRLPVFLMGVLAGLLRLQGSGACWHWRQPAAPLTTAQWAKNTDLYTFNCLTVLLICIVADTTWEGAGIGSFWIQILVADLQLQLVWSLTADEGQSLTARVLTHPWMLWLGEVSFALYLIHEPILYYLVYSVRGKATWGTVDNEEDDFDPEVEAHQLPGWLIPVHVALSLLAAAGLYYHFELPVSNWMRPAKSPPAGGAARGGALPPTETQVVVQKGSYLEGYGSTHSSTTGGQ